MEKSSVFLNKQKVIIMQEGTDRKSAVQSMKRRNNCAAQNLYEFARKRRNIFVGFFF